jgi:hypothetical protein
VSDEAFSRLQALRGIRPCLAYFHARGIAPCLARFERLNRLTALGKERLRALKEDAGFCPRYVGMGPNREINSCIDAKPAFSFALSLAREQHQSTTLSHANNNNNNSTAKDELAGRLCRPTASEAYQYRHVLLRCEHALILREQATRLKNLRKSFSQDVSHVALESHVDRHVTRVASIEHVIQLLRHVRAVVHQLNDCKARRVVFKAEQENGTVRFIVPLNIPLTSMLFFH